ncbi:MAG: DUF4112 domain-containing protein [Oculatellaceae cyanobacterium Prado106]|jgi:hypothetical protein|nr:DUF4112 domain-containing protein [Oculatellaceae cyanobacterium Prado106]
MSKTPVTSAAVPAEHAIARIERLRTLSFWLDNAIAIPGTCYRIGLDPILGLIPGGGDTMGFVLSCWMVLEASRLGADKPTLGRMAFNILLEMLVGIVPVAGDFFDVVWKSNAQNMRLLDEHFKVQVPRGRSRQNRGFALLLIVGLALILITCIAFSVVVLQWLYQVLIAR